MVPPFRPSLSSAPDAPHESQRRASLRPPGVQPPLSPAYALAWSYSRHRMLRHCERSVFWSYFGCRNQGLEPGDRSAPLAWALKHLQTVPLLVGTVVHNAAQRVAKAVIAGDAPPSFAELLAGARYALNQAWTNSQPSHIDGWWEHPTHYLALQEVVDRGHLEPWEIARARIRLGRCLEALLNAPLLDDLRAAGPGATWLPPAGPTSFSPLLGVAAWGAVDAAYRHSDLVAVYEALAAQDGPEGGSTGLTAVDAEFRLRDLPADPTWTISDFKTASRPDPDGEALQLGAYALWLESTDRPATGGAYLGRIVDLVAREDRWILLDAGLLERTRTVIADDVAHLRGLMLDPKRAIPRPKADWKLAANQRRCGSCRFHRLCTPERDDVLADVDGSFEDAEAGSAELSTPPTCARPTPTRRLTLLR